MADDNRDVGEVLREIFASAAAHEDDEAAGKMVRDYLGTEDALTMLAARCRVLERELAERDASFKLRWDAGQRAIERWRAERPEARELVRPDHADLLVWLMGRLEGLGNAAMAVANDCQDVLDGTDSWGLSLGEMARGFVDTLGPAIEAAFPGAERPYRWPGASETTMTLEWGEGDDSGAVSFRVANPPDEVDSYVRANADFAKFLLGLEREFGVALERVPDVPGVRWRMFPDLSEKAGSLVGRLVDHLRGAGFAEVAE